MPQYLILHRTQCEICMEGIVWMASKGIVSSMNQQLWFFCTEKKMVLQLGATYATCVKCQAPHISQAKIHIYCKKTLFTQYLLMQHEANVVHTISQNHVFICCIHLEPSIVCVRVYSCLVWSHSKRNVLTRQIMVENVGQILISWEVEHYSKLICLDSPLLFGEKHA